MAAKRDYRKILGESIRQQREKARLTQEKLAELADIHPNYLGEIERGENTASVATLIRIGKSLNVSISRLLRGI